MGLLPGPDPSDYGRTLTDILTDMVQNLFRAPVLLAGFVMTWLQFRDSQQAEYLADGLAAKVAGSSAKKALLRKLMLFGLMEPAQLSLYPFSKNQDRRIFDVMGHAIAAPDADVADRAVAQATSEKSRADATHPPSVYRLAFIDVLGEIAPAIHVQDHDFSQIEEELGEEADRLGMRLMQSLEPQ